MEKKLFSKDMQLWRRIDEALYFAWDPIGVSKYPEIRDEYERYVPKIYMMVKARADAKDIADQLCKFAHEEMDIEVNSSMLKKNVALAEYLLKCGEIIDRKIEN